MKILAITPPLLQFNTPYPAGPALASFLNDNGHSASHVDVSLLLIRRIFSKKGMQEVSKEITAKYGGKRNMPDAISYFIMQNRKIPQCIEHALRFLAEPASSDARSIAEGRSIPIGPRFIPYINLTDNMSVTDKARLVTSLFIDDISDAIRIGIDPNFNLARYAEHLAAEVPSFSPIYNALKRKPTLIDRMLDEITLKVLKANDPEAVCITIPFPGTMYGAMRIAKTIKAAHPGVRIIIGGGYVNTELRAIKDRRIFKLADYIVYDDGEIPLLRILDDISHGKNHGQMVRTRILQNGRITDHGIDSKDNIRHDLRPAPLLENLRKTGYFPMFETPNPMHRLWGSRPWIKLQIAHGCYWHKCSFCDTTLDYIKRFDPASPETVVRWMQETSRSSGETGFHFVDEAAPPALLAGIATILIKKKLKYSWWANIRFEKSFDSKLAGLLARSGCIALTGGVEAADDRLLCLMDKGISLEQAAKTTKALSKAGIMVHAYLMYGFPTQTLQDAVNALEYVRRLFVDGCIQSAYWHRFALTVHSRMFSAPDKYGITRPAGLKSTFSVNESPFSEKKPADHYMIGNGLRKAVFNYMLGIGLDLPVSAWFEGKVPSATLPGSPI